MKYYDLKLFNNFKYAPNANLVITAVCDQACHLLYLAQLFLLVFHSIGYELSYTSNIKTKRLRKNKGNLLV